MRLSESNISNSPVSKYKILAVDDESGILESLEVFLRKAGYTLTGVTNPLEAIEMVKNDHYDLMLLDFLMTPIHGDKVVEEIRKFNTDLYILLLTGQKDLAPPLDTIRRLQIQGYCEKSDKFDQLLLLIESAVKSIEQMNIIKKINEELKESQEKLEQAYLESIETLRYTVEAKDVYTKGHSERVAEFSVLIGEKIGLSEAELKTLRIGGLFHDIGKIGIPDSILLKESKLTDDEYSEIKNHPAIGKHILSNATLFQNIIPIVYHHHEKYNGTGYPEKLAGEAIPLYARIAAIADTFDAMTSKRSYRNALPLDIVKEEIAKCAGTQFDPELANVFLDILTNEYDKIQEIQNKF